MERTEYIIISDRERKDFNCPGYIQRILSSPEKLFVAMGWVNRSVRRKHSKRSLMKLPKKPLRNIKSFLLILWSIPNSTRDEIVFLYGGDKMKMDDNSTTVILTALALSFILLLQFIYK